MRRPSPRALQRAVESPALHRGRRLQNDALARAAGACDSNGSSAQSTVEALWQGVRGSLPRPHPALADRGVVRAALCALQCAQARRVELAYATRSALLRAVVRRVE